MGDLKTTKGNFEINWPLVVPIFFKKTRFEIFLTFKVEDRIKLLANIEMDEDLIRLREKQIKEQQKQVLPKPNIDNNNAVKQGNLLKGIEYWQQNH